MDNLWNKDKKTSHTISKEILQKTNMSILWEMYGECTPIDLPYNEEHQLFFPYVSHSLNFAKICDLSEKRTLTTFRERRFSHGYLTGCSRLVKSSERVAIQHQTGCQKSLTSGRKFYMA